MASELTKQIVKNYKDQLGRTIDRNDERIKDFEDQVKVIEAENDRLKVERDALSKDIEEQSHHRSWKNYRSEI